MMGYAAGFILSLNLAVGSAFAQQLPLPSGTTNTPAANPSEASSPGIPASVTAPQGAPIPVVDPVGKTQPSERRGAPGFERQSRHSDVMGASVEGLSPRDPFRLPEELIIKIRQKNAMSTVGGIDPAVDPIRRFPLASYQLVGIIWDVKRPKAMFLDRVNNIHMVQVNDFIGNARGVVTSIQNGSVTVLEGKIPQIIKLKK